MSKKVWNVTSLAQVRIFSGHTSSVNAIEMLSNGFLITGSSDNKYIVWNLNGTQRSNGNGANGKIVTRILQTSARQLVIGADDTSIYFYNITSTGTLVQVRVSGNHFSNPCNSMVMVNWNTIWVASETTTIFSFHINTTLQMSSQSMGSNSIRSLEYLGD